ncbi:MAG: hypothetical protein IJ039_08620 [Clostridia bacterium]|nr:hypothetical protein [Clostridia bacterium]
MDEKARKGAIIRTMTEVECHQIPKDIVAIQEYNGLSFAELSTMGMMFDSVAPMLKKVIKGDNAEKLYKMIMPLKGKGGKVTDIGNIYKKGKRGVVARARYVEVDPKSVGMIAQIDPTIMLMAMAISCVTKKLDQIEEAQKDLIEFLQLKEKARLKGNIAVLQEALEEYKYNCDNEKYKNNKHIQVQEIKRDAEQSIIFSRDQIEKKVNKRSYFHSDRDVKSKIQKVQYEFKDYELAMYIFAFSSFMEVMLLENFDSGYLNSIINKIELYAGMYRDLHKKCYKMIEEYSKTSVQAYVLKGVAGLNKALGKGISKIPKISNGRVDEALIGAGERVDDFNDKRTESTMELFASEECSCVRPFVDNIRNVNMIYNEPTEILFDSEGIYFKLIVPKETE